MSPEIAPIVEKLADQGITALMLFLAVYYLSRALKSQYEARIAALEAHVRQCEQHRLELGGEIRTMQNERIGLLEGLLADRGGE